MLDKVEHAALPVGLHMNVKKIQFMTFKQPHCMQIKPQDGSNLKEVKDFKYLGAWMQSTEINIRTRKCMAWQKISRKTNQIFCRPASSRHRLWHPCDWIMYAGHEIVESHHWIPVEDAGVSEWVLLRQRFQLCRSLFLHGMFGVFSL